MSHRGFRQPLVKYNKRFPALTTLNDSTLSSSEEADETRDSLPPTPIFEFYPQLAQWILPLNLTPDGIRRQKCDLLSICYTATARNTEQKNADVLCRHDEWFLSCSTVHRRRRAEARRDKFQSLFLTLNVMFCRATQQLTALSHPFVLSFHLFVIFLLAVCLCLCWHSCRHFSACLHMKRVCVCVCLSLYTVSQGVAPDGPETMNNLPDPLIILSDSISSWSNQGGEAVHF